MSVRGRPHMSVRMNREEIDALNEHARKTGTTHSEIIRTLVYEYMEKHGIKPAKKPIEGQISTDELDV